MSQLMEELETKINSLKVSDNNTYKMFKFLVVELSDSYKNFMIRNHCIEIATSIKIDIEIQTISISDHELKLIANSYKHVIEKYAKQLEKDGILSLESLLYFVKKMKIEIKE